jgi:hypothetical protein
VQLTRASSAIAMLLLIFATDAKAQVGQFDTTHSLYHEAPTRSRMTVYTPATDLAVTPAEWLTVRAGWEADVVSGASVAVKAGPAYKAANAGADVITTASVRDLRNVGRGGFTLGRDATKFIAGYSYSTENDYKSHAITLGARTDVFEHNTQFELSYAKNLDRVCDRVQGAGEQAPRFRALEDSSGCFTSGNPLRTTRGVELDGFQASWSQAWTPVLATQVVFTSQIINGFQSNPYRSVIVGQGLKAQEHVPENRARASLAVRGNWFLRALRAALRFGARGYLDTWDIKSATAEAEFEKYFSERLRLMARARYYAQSGALFFSDDYTGGNRPLGPKGQYFSGDREQSPFTSIALGLRASYTIVPAARRVVGLFTSLKFGATADAIQFDYSEFTLGGERIRNARAFLLALNASVIF